MLCKLSNVRILEIENRLNTRKIGRPNLDHFDLKIAAVRSKNFFWRWIYLTFPKYWSLKFLRSFEPLLFFLRELWPCIPIKTERPAPGLSSVKHRKRHTLGVELLAQILYIIIIIIIVLYKFYYSCTHVVRSFLVRFSNLRHSTFGFWFFLWLHHIFCPSLYLPPSSCYTK